MSHRPTGACHTRHVFVSRRIWSFGESRFAASLSVVRWADLGEGGGGAADPEGGADSARGKPRQEAEGVVDGVVRHYLDVIPGDVEGVGEIPGGH